MRDAHIRRLPLALAVAVAFVSSGLVCSPADPAKVFRSRLFTDGGLPDADWDARRRDYLAFATAQLEPGAVANVMAHLVREEIDPGFRTAPGAVPADAWDPIFARVDTLRDTSDFHVVRFLRLWYGWNGHPMVPAALWQRVERTLLDFKYWYVDPTPAGLQDDMWYWSENHRILFHAAEYLAGQAFPNVVFRVTGWTGAAHRARGRAAVLAWLDERARYGFFEWHSHVYYEEDLFALLTLLEHADDPEIVTRASMLVDQLLFDVARMSFRGSFAGPHGRTYKKDKMTARDQDTWNVSKMLFDTAESGYTSRSATSAVMLAGSRLYRMPAVIREAARDTGPSVDREHLGLAFDEHEPVVPGVPPAHPSGIPYGDPATLEIWWSLGALTSWQVLPNTFDAIQRYGLWETSLFAPFAVLRPLVESGQIGVVQALAQSLASAASVGLLGAVDSYAYRTPDYLLASAQDHRKGSRRDQAHAWQATFDADAIVFTTHPATPPAQTLDWSVDDGPGFWTGSASLPRTAQHENVAIHVYSPQYAASGPPLDVFTRQLPYTHAYFPQERFDEVIQHGRWTFGRRRDGYVALYSHRPAVFVPTPPGVATNGLAQPFELRAEGGADDVWIVECGRGADWGSFAAFRDAIAASLVTVTPTTDGLRGGAPGPAYDVVYESPSQGRLEFGWVKPLRVRGEVVPITGYGRYDNRFAHTVEGALETTIWDAASGTGLHLDFGRGERIPFRRR